METPATTAHHRPPAISVLRLPMRPCPAGQVALRVASATGCWPRLPAPAGQRWCLIEPDQRSDIETLDPFGKNGWRADGIGVSGQPPRSGLLGQRGSDVRSPKAMAAGSSRQRIRWCVRFSEAAAPAATPKPAAPKKEECPPARATSREAQLEAGESELEAPLDRIATLEEEQGDPGPA